MFKNFKISTKLIIGFITIALLVGVVGYVSSNSFQKVGEAVSRSTNEIAPLIIESNEIGFEGSQIHILIVLYITQGGDKDKLEASINTFEELVAKYEENMKKVAPGSFDMINTLDLKAKKMNSIVRELINLKDQGMSVKDLDKKERSDFHGALEDLNKEIERHTDFHMEELGKVNTAVSQMQAKNQRIILIIVIVAIILAIIIGFYLSYTISRSITRMRNAAVEIARGNMDVEIDTSGKDEVAELSQAIDRMRQSLKVVMEEYEKKIKP